MGDFMNEKDLKQGIDYFSKNWWTSFAFLLLFLFLANSAKPTADIGWMIGTYTGTYITLWIIAKMFFDIRSDLRRWFGGKKKAKT